MKRRLYQSAAALALFAVALAIGLRWTGSRTEAAGVLERPDRLWGTLAERPILGRLAGLASYRPYRGPGARALAEESDVVTKDSRGTEAPYDFADEALAVSWLVEGRYCHTAVRTLHEIAHSGSRKADWTTWNDLSVALLECAPGDLDQVGAAFRGRLEAAQAVSQALALSPGSEEALFNQALVLEALHVPIQAAKAWQRYLGVDPVSGWAGEAQIHLDQLRQGHVQSTPERSAQVPPSAFQARLSALIEDPGPQQAKIRDLVDDADAAGQADVAASATRLLAYRTSLDGRLATALDLYADAAVRFDALGDSDSAATARAMRAEILAELGRPDEAARELAAVLPAASEIRNPWQRYSTYWVAANALASTAPTAAYLLWSEAAEACSEMPDRKFCVVDARIRLARRASNLDWAASELAAAERELTKEESSPGKDRTELDLAMAEAEWLLRGEEPSSEDLETANRLYSGVIQGFRALGSPASVAEAQAARADVLAHLGLAAQARAQLEESLLSLRRWDDDQRFRPDAAEAGTPAALRTVFEQLIRLHLAASGSEVNYSAFLLAEEMRDRLAPRLDRRFTAMTEEDLPSIVEFLPADTAAVEMVVLSPARSQARMAVAWVFAEGAVQQVDIPIDKGVEGPLREARLAADLRSLERWKGATAELWRRLMAPVLAAIPLGTRRLVIVPDSELYGVPFRGLWNPETGRYLDEDFEVLLAPSLRSLTRPRSLERRDQELGPILAVGFQHFLALGLPELGSATVEKQAVASVYPVDARSECKVTDWPSLRRCLPEAKVVHLATHAAASSQSPSWSWLALPEETVSLARLWSELPPLPRRPLVVLSACESVATAAGGEGLGGLARPFLARGARSVVGTLWPINDAEAAAFFPLFHQAYFDTGQVVGALRVARERLAGWRDNPWTWGAVAVIETGN